jgi:hypothetical protein
MAFDGTVPTLNGTPTSVSNGSGSDSSAYEDREGNVIVPVASKISHRCAATFFTQVEVLAGRELKNLKRQVDCAHIVTSRLMPQSLKNGCGCAGTGRC